MCCRIRLRRARIRTIIGGMCCARRRSDAAGYAFRWYRRPDTHPNTRVGRPREHWALEGDSQVKRDGPRRPGASRLGQADMEDAVFEAALRRSWASECTTNPELCKSWINSTNIKLRNSRNITSKLGNLRPRTPPECHSYFRLVAPCRG